MHALDAYRTGQTLDETPESDQKYPLVQILYFLKYLCLCSTEEI